MKKPKKSWVQGVDIPAFSGKTREELNDVWPIDMRTKSDAYYMVCTMYPAFIMTKKTLEAIIGKKINTHADTDKSIRFSFRELFILSWISRCEESIGGTLAPTGLICKGLDQLQKKGGVLIRCGLAEYMGKSKAIRITEKGRIILREFVENIDKVHRKLSSKEWKSEKRPRGRKPKEVPVQGEFKVID